MKVESPRLYNGYKAPFSILWSEDPDPEVGNNTSLDTKKICRCLVLNVLLKSLSNNILKNSVLCFFERTFTDDNRSYLPVNCHENRSTIKTTTTTKTECETTVSDDLILLSISFNLSAVNFIPLFDLWGNRSTVRLKALPSVRGRMVRNSFAMLHYFSNKVARTSPIGWPLLSQTLIKVTVSKRDLGQRCSRPKFAIKSQLADLYAIWETATLGP